MKKVLLFVFSVVSLLANGQQKKTIEFSVHINSIDPLPELGNFKTSSNKLLGFGDFTNNSIAAGLTCKYFIADNCAVYIKGVYTNRHYNEHQDILNSTHQINENITKQQMYKIAPGIQWSFTYKKVAFIAGFDLPLTFYGDIVQNANSFNENLDGSNKINTLSLSRIHGGSSYGIGLFGGLNYYFIKKCAIGFTLGSAYERRQIGGTWSWHSVTTGAVNDEFTASYEDSIKDLAFAPLQASINLTLCIK